MALPSATNDNSLALCLLLHFLSASSSSSRPLAFLFACIAVYILLALLRWLSPGGPAWSSCSASSRPPIPGPRGLPFLGSLLSLSSLAHRRLASIASSHRALPLMAFSLASTRVVVSSKPDVAHQLLSSPAFADRPPKQSAHQLFSRAIGFAPYGDYWRRLRQTAASHLFTPCRIAAHEYFRQLEISEMLDAIAMNPSKMVTVRPYLQHAALNNIMSTVFGRRYRFGSNCEEATELQSMVREGFELLGAFNWVDYFPALECFDPHRIRQRCDDLVPRVYAFVQKIIDEHRSTKRTNVDSTDFVDVLLSLQTEEKLADSDVVAILWEMIFRGTDTIAILIEWILAELVLNPCVQDTLNAEILAVVGKGGHLRDADIVRMPYVQAVVKESLRLHPPGPLLSWARLAIHDVEVAGHLIPAGTTAMVNMWAITHDPSIWSDPERFIPERFLPSEGGTDMDLRGSDLRLAPFGAGRRVCPGKALALTTVNLWVARIVQRFRLSAVNRHSVDLTESLKLSCEMAVPLLAQFTDRRL